MLTAVWDVEAMTHELIVKSHKKRGIQELEGMLNLLACLMSTANITHRISSSIQNADRKIVRG